MDDLQLGHGHSLGQAAHGDETTKRSLAIQFTASTVPIVPLRPLIEPRRRKGRLGAGLAGLPCAGVHTTPARFILRRCVVTIDLVLLGTGNPLPDRDRAGAATLVRAGGLTLLVDAGRAVCMRLAAAGVLPFMLDAVLLTHLHSDHICDLNDVVTTQWVMSPVPKPLRVFGPPRTREVMDGLGAMLRPDVEYRLAHHADLTWEPQVEVVEVLPGIVLDQAGLRVIAARTDHRPVEPTLGYRVEFEGKAVVLAGDTVPCAGLDDLCRGADAYVQTVLREDLVRLVPMQRFVDTIDYHSTVVQAAQTAARGGVGTLVLTHQIPTPMSGAKDEWVAIARQHFDGAIIFGEDLASISI
jgi:ribonuclease Z